MCSAGNQPKQQKRGLDRFHQNQMDEMMTWGFFKVITRMGCSGIDMGWFGYCI